MFACQAGMHFQYMCLNRLGMTCMCRVGSMAPQTSHAPRKKHCRACRSLCTQLTSYSLTLTLSLTLSCAHACAQFILSADMGYQFLDGAPPTNAPPSFVQGVTNSGNPGAAAVSASLAVEVQQNNATLVLLNGDITYAECAAAPHASVSHVSEGCDQCQWCCQACSFLLCLCALPLSRCACYAQASSHEAITWHWHACRQPCPTCWRPQPLCTA